MKIGRYEQDGNTKNGPEEIEWIVLDVQGGKALLTSLYGLDSLPYHSRNTDITWENCSVRQWLNDEFLNTAFSPEELVYILTTEVDNSAEQCYSEWSTNGGSNTLDRVFLLSYAEANRYFGAGYEEKENMKAKIAPTAYAAQQGAKTSGSSRTEDDQEAACWYLRSPGYYLHSVASIGAGGRLCQPGVDTEGSVVRPAIWLDVNYISGSESNELKAENVPESLAVNSIVRFGHYEQDNDSGNGREKIEWIVLDIQGGKALLTSRYGLDMLPYNTKYDNVTWETCTVRKWLNNDFISAAFSQEEQIAILTTRVDNSEEQNYSKWNENKVNDTADRIFLLSYAEANRYFGVTFEDEGNKKARIKPTAYAKAQGAETSKVYRTEDDEEAGWWFLRSPGYYLHSASCVDSKGGLSQPSVERLGAVVRPAFWMNMNYTDLYEIADE